MITTFICSCNSHDSEYKIIIKEYFGVIYIELYRTSHNDPVYNTLLKKLTNKLSAYTNEPISPNFKLIYELLTTQSKTKALLNKNTSEPFTEIVVKAILYGTLKKT